MTFGDWPRCAYCDKPVLKGARVCEDHSRDYSPARHYQSPLRDLIVQLDRVAQRHPAYPQAAAAMHHLRDHLSALARCEEINQDAERQYRR